MRLVETETVLGKRINKKEGEVGTLQQALPRYAAKQTRPQRAPELVQEVYWGEEKSERPCGSGDLGEVDRQEEDEKQEAREREYEVNRETETECTVALQTSDLTINVSYKNLESLSSSTNVCVCVSVCV